MMPSAETTAMRSAAFSTNAAKRVSVASTCSWAARSSLRSRATTDTRVISPALSRWATSTAETGTGPSPDRNVSRPRHRPSFTSAGSTLTS